MPLIALVVLLVVAGAYGGSRVLANAGSHTTDVGQPTTTAAPSSTPALVPVGLLIYNAESPGECDSQGARWQQNATTSSMSQQCIGGELIMSDADCNCAIGIVTLASIPSEAYPDDYVAEVTVKSISSAPTAKLGLKFRQQSPGDDGQGRGGYSFLIDPNGQWQFNRYDADGARHILVQEQLAQKLPNGQSHVLDLVVHGSSFSIYLDGNLLDTQNDSTYPTGFFCLAVEPGASVSFSHLTLFQLP